MANIFARIHAAIELAAASDCAERGHASEAFHRLERAHVLSTRSTREHICVHWRMLRWAVGQRDVKEIAGQLLRLAAAATITGLGLVPSGNTGGARISPFRAMPIPSDLAPLLADTSK